MKNAYLLVSDLHYAESKANRLNYLGEILDIITHIIELGAEFRRRGFSPKLIFMGDVIDSSMANAEEAMRGVDIFRYMISEFDAAYSVVGNHEETYVTNNPFWYLVGKIDDTILGTLPRPIQPKSIYPCLTLPDVLVDGEVTFYFNHYGVPARVPRIGGVAIGLFHQNVGSNDICKMWGTFDDVEDAAYIQAYNFCFFGHMHMAYGKFFLNESHTCVGEWLGSCGRSNILEVENAPLQVNIPAILVEGGKFISVEDNYIERSPAEVVINYDKVNVMRETAKSVKELRDKVPANVCESTLFESVQKAADLAGFGAVMEMLLGSYDNLLFQYKESLKQVSDIVFDEIDDEEDDE